MRKKRNLLTVGVRINIINSVYIHKTFHNVNTILNFSLFVKRFLSFFFVRLPQFDESTPSASHTFIAFASMITVDDRCSSADKLLRFFMNPP